MNRKNCWYFGLLCLFIFLNSCATPSTQHEYWQPYTGQSLDFNASGRLSVKFDNQGSHGNFDWDNRSSRQLHIININTPIGNTIGQLCQDSLGAIAKNNQGKIFTAQNSANLSEKLLGVAIPIDYLDLWVNGYIPTQLPYRVSGNKLSQDNWLIERILNRDNTTKMITLQKNNLLITIIIDELSNTANNSHSSETLFCPDR